MSEWHCDLCGATFATLLAADEEGGPCEHTRLSLPVTCPPFTMLEQLDGSTEGPQVARAVEKLNEAGIPVRWCANPPCEALLAGEVDYCPECAAEIQRLRDALRAMGSA